MMFKNYKFDIFVGIAAVAACGLASFGIIHATQALTLLFKIMGLAFAPAFAISVAVLILVAVFFSFRKKK